MIVKIIGKRVVSGINPKTKKHRCGTVIHTTYSDDSVNGTAVKSFWVNAGLCSPEKINIGDHFHIIEEHNYVSLCEQCEETEV